MAAPLIPYTFDPASDEYETDHLVYETVTGGEQVSWPLIGASLFLPKTPEEHSFSLEAYKFCDREVIGGNGSMSASEHAARGVKRPRLAQSGHFRPSAQR